MAKTRKKKTHLVTYSLNDGVIWAPWVSQVLQKNKLVISTIRKTKHTKKIYLWTRDISVSWALLSSLGIGVVLDFFWPVGHVKVVGLGLWWWVEVMLDGMVVQCRGGRCPHSIRPLSPVISSPKPSCCCSWVLRWGRCQLVVDVGVVDGWWLSESTWCGGWDWGCTLYIW